MMINDSSAVISETDRAGKAIASYSEILFRLSQDDPADMICSKLELAAASLQTDDISGSTDSGRHPFMNSGSHRIKELSEEIENFRSELSDSLTELYMHKELLSTVSDRTSKESEILDGCRKKLTAMNNETERSQSEKALLTHCIRDSFLSQTVAQNNISIAENWLIRTESLISGLISFETHMIPLWKTRYAAAERSSSDDDLKSCFETAALFAEKLSELISAC